MKDENFYIQLKKFFKNLGLSQRQIADQLGVKQSYVNLMLNGRNPIGRHNAQKFHDAYGLSVAWLLTGEGDMMARGAAAVNTINIDAADNRSNTITAQGGSSVSHVSQAAGGDAATLERLLDQNAQLIEQNKKLIDLLAASYKNNNN